MIRISVAAVVDGHFRNNKMDEVVVVVDGNSNKIDRMTIGRNFVGNFVAVVVAAVAVVVVVVVVELLRRVVVVVVYVVRIVVGVVEALAFRIREETINPFYQFGGDADCYFGTMNSTANANMRLNLCNYFKWSFQIGLNCTFGHLLFYFKFHPLF